MNPLISYHDKLQALMSACLQANPDLVKRIETHSNCNANVSELIRAVDVKLLLMKDVSDRRLPCRHRQLLIMSLNLS